MTQDNPVFLTFSDKPRTILRELSAFDQQKSQFEQANARRSRLPSFLLVGGGVCFVLELLFTLVGYPANCIFVMTGVFFWVGALVTSIANRKNRLTQLPSQYEGFRELVHTLRDDTNPKYSMIGQLDLRGVEMPAKVAREAKNALGRQIIYYRDNWLSLKTRLYDGNTLRIQAVRRQKVRAGFSRRGKISHKTKWKAPVVKGDVQELKVVISLNAERYDINASPSLKLGTKIGSYQVSFITMKEGILVLNAQSAESNIEMRDILGVLRAAYDQLKVTETPLQGKGTS